MTTYKNVDYETSEALREAINAEFAALAYPYAVRHKVYGEGQLTFVKAPLLGGSLYATVEFSAGVKTLALDVILTNQLLDMPDILMDTLLEAQSVFKADFIERQEAQLIADRAAREQERKAKKEAEEAKKAEEQYESTKSRTIKEFDILRTSKKRLNTTSEFYYSLGWLAAHVGTIQAAIPDYLKSHFESKFGTDATPYIYDSKKKTSGGFRYQWSFGFSARLRSKGLTEIPATLSERLSSSTSATKSIADTSFIWDLVDNYGFKFGKEQDIEEIRSHIPADYMADFDAGFAA